MDIVPYSLLLGIALTMLSTEACAAPLRPLTEKVSRPTAVVEAVAGKKLVRWTVDTDRRLASRGMLAGYSTSATAKAPEVWQARDENGTVRWTLDIAASMPDDHVTIVAAVGTKSALYVATRCANRPCNQVLRFGGPEKNESPEEPALATLKYALADVGAVEAMWRHGPYLLTLAPVVNGIGGFQVRQALDGSLLARIDASPFRDLSGTKVSISEDKSFDFSIELATPDGEAIQLVVDKLGDHLVVKAYWMVGPSCEKFGARVRKVCLTEEQSPGQVAICDLARAQIEELLNPEEYLDVSAIGPDGYHCVEMEGRFDTAFTRAAELPPVELASLSWANDCRAAVATLDVVCSDASFPESERRKCNLARELATDLLKATIIGAQDRLNGFLCRSRLNEATEMQKLLPL